MVLKSLTGQPDPDPWMCIVGVLVYLAIISLPYLQSWVQLTKYPYNKSSSGCSTVMATVAAPEDHDGFDVSDVDSNPLGVYYEAIL